MNDIVCAGPGCNLKRYKSSLHCNEHIKEFAPMYKKYKKAQVPIDKYIVNPELIKNLDNIKLLQIVGICNNVTELRKAYQFKALKPIFQDSGHEQFIRQLHVMSNKIVEILSLRFNIDESIPENNVDRSVEDDDIEPFETKNLEKNKQSQLGQSSKDSIAKFLQQKDELNIELEKLINSKNNHYDDIRISIMEVFDVINKHMKNQDLTINERGVVFICAIDLLENFIHHGINSSIQEEIYLGGMIEQGYNEIDRIIKYENDNEIPIIKHIMHKKYNIIKWDEMPSSINQCIELIYQGRRPRPKIPDENICKAISALIEKSRKEGEVFSYHFDVDIFNNNKIIVHTCELTSSQKTYYPHSFKKKHVAF
jgi:hypothetical protein